MHVELDWFPGDRQGIPAPYLDGERYVARGKAVLLWTCGTERSAGRMLGMLGLL
jgi:hypothetical protein